MKYKTFCCHKTKVVYVINVIYVNNFFLLNSFIKKLYNYKNFLKKSF